MQPITEPCLELVIYVSPDNPPIEEEKPQWKIVLGKVWEIAKQVLFGLLGAVLFYSNPTVFAVSFLVAVIWPDKAREIVDRVKMIWEQQTIPMLVITGVGLFLTVHVTLAAAAGLYALHLGALVSERAKALHEGKEFEFKLI